MPADAVLVFCDGAAKGNPGPGGWGVVIATPDGQVTELGGRAAETTNNRMELTAAIQALDRTREAIGRLDVYTDSTYVIKGIREWIRTWRRNGWTRREGGAVLNRDLWQQLDALVSARPRGGVTWHYVRGHTGVPGNERVDTIADHLAKGKPVDLYQGPLSGYPLPIFDVPTETAVPTRTDASSHRPKRPAFSYLSVIDGEARRHATWSECESRVRGRSGARFKKALNRDDEIAILRAWGLPPDAV